MLVISSLSSFWNSLITNNRHADPSSSKRLYCTSLKRDDSLQTDSLQSVMTINDQKLHLSCRHVHHSMIPSPSVEVAYTHPIPYSNTHHWPGLRFSMTYTLSPPTYEQTDIVLQDYGTDGLLPPPPVSDSWRRIDRWAQIHYPELYDQLSYGATIADVDELEHELGYPLPRDVHYSFAGNSGYFFLLPEFKFWYSATRATLIAFICSWISFFDIPVFVLHWPILLMYFCILFTFTMRRQIKHMIKYKYVPFDIGKKRFSSK
ncbi:hypothetical protein PCK2_000017 [Pneumocystis canis]|nr:hypothetical protein PCK2_000017 [Pneumocystis canis]